MAQTITLLSNWSRVPQSYPISCPRQSWHLILPQSMTTSTKKVSIIERSGVAPPAAAGEAAEQRLPLTFFDMLWMYFHPIQRLLFYQHPCSATDFVETIVPTLKQSLSQTLTHYLPLAGNLFYPMNSGMPELRYVPGDSVTLMFTESSQALTFSYLIGDQARDADDFHYLIPDLPESRTDSESGFKIFPLFAIQVTLFPGAGIAIGVTNHHVVGDASSIVGFIKAWSSAAKLGDSTENHKLPFYDRSVIKDPTGRANIFWNQMRALQFGTFHSSLPTNKVRTTFVLHKKEIETLKNLVLARKPGSIHLSSFTVTIAYVWSCFSRSAAEAGEVINDDEPEYYGFAVDARSRIDPPVPSTYFGNCLAFVVAESTHGQMKGKDGFFVAAELIGELISEKVNKKEELLRDADNWLVKYGPLYGKRSFGVAGSPKFDLYDTDFGWGKPKKYEAVSIDGDPNLSISLCKSREFEGGLEIGVSLPKKNMDAFEAAFSDGLKRQNFV